jgi:hypothetical protein
MASLQEGIEMNLGLGWITAVEALTQRIRGGEDGMAGGGLLF